MQCEAWQYGHVLAWPHRSYSFLPAANTDMLSVPWPVGVAQVPDARGLFCSLFPGMGIERWFSVLPYSVLKPGELETWQRIAGPERRRRQWLQGRIAAKDAVRLLLRGRYQLEASYADIEISSNKYGKPVVCGEAFVKLGRCVCLSISHSGKMAAAVAGEYPDHEGVGIDVEPLEQSHEGLEEIAFTSGERTHLSEVPVSRREEWLLRLWCAKEAVAKALGRGFMGNPRNLVVEDVDLERGRVNFRVAGELARKLSDYADRSLTAYTGCDGALVFATSFV